MPRVANLIGQCEGSGVEQPANGTASLQQKPWAVTTALSALHLGTHTLGDRRKGSSPHTPQNLESTPHGAQLVHRWTGMCNGSWSAHCLLTNTSDLDTQDLDAIVDVALLSLKCSVQGSQEGQTSPLSLLEPGECEP